VSGSTAAIEVRGLTKRFGAVTVLDGVTFSVAAGVKVALTGANGAGKSTLLAVISTLAAASGGSFSVAGCEAETADMALRRQIGVLAHSPMVYEELTPLENLRFFARLYGVADGEARAEELLRRVGLWRRRHEATRVLSRGMHQRLAVARALVHRPRVLLLDEPETGLDTEGLELLDETMLRADGVTVLAATHQIERTESWAEARVTLRRGRLVEVSGAGVADAAVAS
jgi:heme exporter protein A